MSETSELTQVEQQAWYEFEKIFEERFPYPVKPDAGSVFRTMGGWFWLIALTAGSALILNALRTASWFYLAGYASSQNIIMGRLEAIFAVMAYEGTIMTLGLMWGRRQKGVNRLLENGVLLLALTTSIAAAMGVSGNVIPGFSESLVSQRMLESLSMAMGLSPILALLSGHLLGAHYAEGERKITHMSVDWNERIREWEARKVSEWQRNRLRMMARVDQDAAQQERANNQRGSGRALTVRPDGFGGITITQAVEQYLRKNSINPLADHIDSTQIAEILSRETGQLVRDGTVRQIIKRIRDRNGHSG